jgi:hypothetical protein
VAQCCRSHGIARDRDRPVLHFQCYGADGAAVGIRVAVRCYASPGDALSCAHYAGAVLALAVHAGAVGGRSPDAVARVALGILGFGTDGQLGLASATSIQMPGGGRDSVQADRSATALAGGGAGS